MNILYDHMISVTEYNQLREAVGWGSLPAVQAQIGINRSDYVIRAMDGKRTIGMARVVSDGGCSVFILDVIVLPEYQGHGIGKSIFQNIMNYLQKELQQRGSMNIGLMAAKGREGFYQQFGFLERPNEGMGAGMTMRLRSEKI